MSYTIPPNTRTPGVGSPSSDIDNVSSVLALMTGNAVGTTFSESVNSTLDWINVVSQYGADPTGATDSTTAIQNALTAARTATYGGVVYLPAGLYIVSNMLQIGSNTALIGDSKGSTTIRMASGSWSSVTQVGSINGLGIIITYNNTTASNIKIEGITFDGNEAGVTVLPSWCSGSTNTCGGIHINNVTGLTIQDCQIINTIGYTVYLQLCTQFKVLNNRVISGQVNTWGLAGTPSAQDGVHLDSCTYGKVDGNYIDTGTYTINVGDDAIALQSYSAIHNITISNNICRSAEAGVDLALSGANIYDITITGNTFWDCQSCGVISQPFTGSGAISYNVTISGNTFDQCVQSNSNGNAAAIALYDYSDFTTGATAWANFSITGNSIYSTGTSGNNFGSAIYTGYGKNVTISGNTIENNYGANGITLGSPGLPTTDFTVTGNVVDVSSSANTSQIVGIFINDSSTGTVTGNLLKGVNSTSVACYGVAVVGTTSGATGVNVSENSFVNWNSSAGAISVLFEFNNGATADYNNWQGNIMHSCSMAPYNQAGPHSIWQQQPIDFGGLPLIEQFVCLSSPYTLTSTTSEQKLFNATTNGAITLQPGLYFFECQFSLSSMSTTSGNTSFSILGAGNATVSSTAWSAVGLDATTQTTAAAVGGSMQVTSTSVGDIVTAGAGTAMSAAISGTIRISAAGTIIPSVGLTTAIAAVVGTNSWFRIWPVSPTYTATYVGNWS